MSGLIIPNFTENKNVQATAPRQIVSDYHGIMPSFNGAPGGDTFEPSEKKHTRKTVAIVSSVLLALAGSSVFILAHKGGKILGKDAKFGEKIERGFREFFW